MSDAIERFAGDLQDAGIDRLDAMRLTDLYGRALRFANAAEWRRLYRATFLALRRSAAEPVSRSYVAVDSLLRLLEDDLGVALFGGEAIGRLRERVMAR